MSVVVVFGLHSHLHAAPKRPLYLWSSACVWGLSPRSQCSVICLRPNVRWKKGNMCLFNRESWCLRGSVLSLCQWRTLISGHASKRIWVNKSLLNFNPPVPPCIFTSQDVASGIIFFTACELKVLSLDWSISHVDYWVLWCVSHLYVKTAFSSF